MSRRLEEAGQPGVPSDSMKDRDDAEAEHFFRAIFEQAAIGICCCDFDGRFVRVNRRFCILTGRTENELIGRRFAEITHPDDVAASLQVAEELRAGLRDLVCIEKRYVRPTGEVVWSRTTLSLARVPTQPARHVIVTAEEITGQKQAEAQLAASLSRTADILARISDGYFVLSRDWIYTDINLRAAEMVGKMPGELLNRRIWDVFPDAEHSVWRQRYQEVMETGRPCQIVEYYQALDRWYSAAIYPYEGGVAVSFHDVTAERKLQAELRANETRLLSIQRIARVGAWTLDLATKRVTLDDIAQQIYDVDPGVFDGSYEAFINLVDPADRPRMRDVDARAMRTGIPAENAYRIIDRKGRPRYVVERTGPGFDASGRRVSVLCTVQDETELHRIEETLRERESLLRQGAEVGHFGTWMWDLTDDRCLFCSEELAALFEMTVEEFLETRGSNRQFKTAALSEDSAVFDAMMAQGPGRSYDVEFRTTSRSGEIRHFREAGRTFRDDATGHIHSIGVTQDITAIKTTEITLRRMVNEASQLQRLAEDANYAKSEFLATMSHELRTPLNAVIGFSEMLLTLGDTLPREQIHDYYATIRESGQHLLDLINDILDLAKVEAGKVEIRLEDVDLTSVVGECTGYLDAAARKRHVTFLIELARRRCKTDRRLIKQILLNLISNAVKFNREGGTIAIDSRADGANLVLTVTDTGAGMDADELRRALQPFVQLEPTYHRTHEGSGLGLALADRFARLLGGRLHLKSEKGRGTTATLTVPLDGVVAEMRAGA